MQQADSVRIKHMLDSSKEIVTFTKDITFKEFENERKLQLSVVHLLEIVGEAEQVFQKRHKINILRFHGNK